MKAVTYIPPKTGPHTDTIIILETTTNPLWHAITIQPISRDEGSKGKGEKKKEKNNGTRWREDPHLGFLIREKIWECSVASLRLHTIRRIEKKKSQIYI